MSTQQREHTWQDMEAAVGQDFSGGVVRVGADPAERGAIRKFCEPLEMDCPLFFDDAVARRYGYNGIIAPVSMVNLTLAAGPIWRPGDPTRWPVAERNALADIPRRAEASLPAPRTTASFVTDLEIEYVAPVYVGDVLIVKGQKLVSVAVRTTSVGEGAFLVFENSIHNQRDELVARVQNGSYRYNPHPPSARPQSRGEAPPRSDGASQRPQRVVPPPRASYVDWDVQRYFEDVQVGDEVPPVTFNMTVQRFVIEAGANRDFNPIHHNTEIAQSQGAPEIYANNSYIQGMWERAYREFIGLGGKVKKVGPFRMRIFNNVAEAVVVRGTVKRKWQDEENFVELEMWSDISRGVSVGPGPVLVTLPSRPR